MAAKLDIQVVYEPGERLREFLRSYDHRDVIEALGESDLIESIGPDRLLQFLEAVALGPVSDDRSFVRARITAIASRIEAEWR